MTLKKEFITVLVNESEVISPFLSLTNLINGKVKIDHQIATLKKENKTASISEAKPKILGCRYINTFTTNNIPPPK